MLPKNCLKNEEVNQGRAGNTLSIIGIAAEYIAESAEVHLELREVNLSKIVVSDALIALNTVL